MIEVIVALTDGRTAGNKLGSLVVAVEENKRNRRDVGIYVSWAVMRDSLVLGFKVREEQETEME